MICNIFCVKAGGPGLVLPDSTTLEPREYDNSTNLLSPSQCYQRLFLTEDHDNPDVIIYIHDDVTIHEKDWLASVESPFSIPEVAVVGLGGAARLGHQDLYKRPYRIEDMARGGYVSNQTDWQVHGGREQGARRVAVVDAFLMAIRTDFLRSIGGWPTKHLTHHCLDLWICCEAARHGKEVWMVGVECTHHGGGTSVKPTYREAKWLQGGTLEEDHRIPHRWLYSAYSDVLPIGVKP